MKNIANRNYFILALVFIFLDQITKILVKGFSIFGFEHYGFNYGESISVLGDFLHFTYIENPGMAFGISFGAGKIFLSLFSIIAASGLAWYLSKIDFAKRAVKLGIALILAGAVGNLIDRVFYGVLYGEMPLFYGKVVDFIQVDIPDINIFGLSYSHWPVFNIADSCVSVGVIVLLFVHNYMPSLETIRPKKIKEETSEEGLD